MEEIVGEEESPIVSRRAFHELFAESGWLPPGRPAAGDEREEAYVRLRTRHRGRPLIAKGARFGSGQTRQIGSVFRGDDLPEEFYLEVFVDHVHNPRVRCVIEADGTARVLEVLARTELSDALRSRLRFVGLDVARSLAPYHRGELWVDCLVTKQGGEEIVYVCGISTAQP